MANSIMLNNSIAFAVAIVEICRTIKERKKESVLVNQLLRAGTSIGANVYESKYAQSTADFISKMQIALKECYETEYWIEIGQKADIISADIAKIILHDCGSIRRMLISSINTAKENAK